MYGGIIIDESKVHGYLATDVLTMMLPPLSPLAENLIVPGVTLLAAPPKYGKSWLMLQLSLAVANGRDFLGEKTQEARVFYFALEDSVRRLQDRLLAVGATKADLENLVLFTAMPRLDDGLGKMIADTCKNHADARLFIIDTLQKVKGANGNRNVYEADYEAMGELKRIADAYNVAIVLVHHLRKQIDDTDPFNRISGSTGLTGAADTMIVLERKKRSSDVTVMHITGRDIESDDIEMRFDKESHVWKRVSANVGTDPVREAYERSGMRETLAFLMEAEHGRYECTASVIYDAVRAIAKKDPSSSPRALVTDLRAWAKYMLSLDGVVYEQFVRQKGHTVHRFTKTPETPETPERP
ncbi:MAG: AAA family ATPase [Oscillospiraceae bacterium]|nr:AAA family ATPase [Oscillospiraceae bacterium]